MNNVQHIHEVLFLFQELGSFSNEDQLFETIKERLGNDVSFTSCCNKPFRLDQVVGFLVKKNKIVKNSDGSLSLHPNMKMCDGHSHHH